MPEPLDDLFNVPAARRKRAFALARQPDLGDFARYFTPARQRSLTGPLRAKGLSDATQRVLESGVKAVEKINAEGLDVPLSRDEAIGYESVVLLADRPALLVQNDQCAPAPEPWTQPLSEGSSAISARLPKVGRIEVRIGNAVREVATGFVVGDGLIMTNRHVVEMIAFPEDPSPDDRTGDTAVPWRIRQNLRPQINFKAEYQVSDDSRIFAITNDPIYTHPRFDLGLIRIAKQSSAETPLQAPSPFTLAGSAPDTTQMKDLYVVGYPSSDTENAIPKVVLDDIFGGIFEVKRLAPGELAGSLDDRGLFVHDCSTLGGNSGSCVIDLNTEQVVGLHFKGSYFKANYAIWLWKLKDFLMAQGVQFD
jgi:V8-like Glu-specific endopeptidase